MFKKDPQPVRTAGLQISKLNVVISILVLLLIAYLVRPWLHSFFMAFYINPLLLVVFVTTILFAYSFYNQWRKISLILGSITLVFVILLSLSPLFVQLYVVSDTEYVPLDTMYESNSPRVVPLTVAKRFGDDSLQKSKEKLGDFDPIIYNDSQYWVSPRVPNGGFLTYFQNVQGVLLVDAQTPRRSTQLIDEVFKVGEQVQIFDNVYWKLYSEKYFITISEIYYVHDGTDFVLVAPYISYNFKFPVMVPEFGGVFVVSPDGTVSTFKSDDLPEYLTRVYPEQLARLQVESYQYKEGLFNAWFIHEDQIELADLPGAGNQQPFLIDTEDGLKWIVATEPYGESYGVFKIFFVDAITGEVELFELNDDETLTGPVRVVSYVRSQFPTIDWSVTDVIEPRPFVKDGELFWLLSIVPVDAAGISQTVFVNAKTNEVVTFTELSEINDFIERGVIVEQETLKDAFEDLVDTSGQDDSTKVTNDNRDEIIEQKLAQIRSLLLDIDELLAQR